MVKKRIFDITINLIQRLKNPSYRGFAAEIAFYFMLSVVPIILILTQILGFFDISVSNLQQTIFQYLPENSADVLSKFIPKTNTGNVSFSVLSGLLALWAASKAQFSLMRIANVTFTGKFSVTNFFRERFIAIKTLIVMIFAFLFSIIILMYGETIIKAVSVYVDNRFDKKLHISYAWYILRWFLAVLVYFFTVSYLYFVLPVIKVKYKDIIPGSIFAASGMWLVTFLYSTFNLNFSNYDLLYGSFAAIISLLVWFWLIGWILMLGILFNAAWIDTKTA